MKIKLLLLTLLLSCGTSHAEIPSSRTWTQTFIGGASNFNVLLWDKSVTGQVYAGSDVSGMYVSTNSGATWTALTGNFPTQGSNAMVRTGNTLYVATNGAGLYKFNLSNTATATKTFGGGTLGGGTF